ncbi:hypothetical protein LCGC14_2979970 [marine sediment metagenome]|uniref:Uncharacterized protein n=1 Tax=marine sediment metagenome TaxID=412755 RepID=A0A0F8X7T0_9ZZZZ
MPEEVLPATDTPPEVAIAISVIPYSRDDEKAKYLGYLSSGLSVREALHMIDRSKTWLSLARRDSVFKDLERRVPEFRKELSKEYVELEFFRNFRLLLEKDHRVLKAALFPDKDAEGKVIPMSMQDHNYLLKLRSQYTPQQLQILEAIVSGSGDGFNFARFMSENPDIIQASRTDTVTMRKQIG